MKRRPRQAKVAADAATVEKLQKAIERQNRPVNTAIAQAQLLRKVTAERDYYRARCRKFSFL